MRLTAAWIIRLVLAAAVLASTINIYAAFRTIGAEAREDQERIRDNIVWYATQQTREVDTLLHAFNAYQLGDESVTSGDVIDRFDVVWSRLAEVDRGRAGELLMGFQGARETIQTARRMIAELEPAMGALERGDLQHAASLNAQIRTLAQQMHGLALTSLHVRNAAMTSRAERVNALRNRIMLLVGNILVCSALLVVLLLRERATVQRLSRGLEDTVQRRTAELEREIAERRAVESALERYRDELETLVEERTAELEAAQLDLLRNERLATIGKVTGTVGHELRNPLGTIRNSFVVLRNHLGSVDGPVERNLDRIERNIKRCNRIIEELLAYTRAPRAEQRPVDLDRWLAETIEDIDVPPGVTLTACLEARATVTADPERLRQAVVNVIQNACQAIAEGDGSARKARGRVHVATSLDAARVAIRVSDDGPGISAEVRERIFEPLFSTRTFGVGLGLPLVKQIIELHRGDVEVGDEPDGGTRLTLWLPLQTPAVANAD